MKNYLCKIFIACILTSHFYGQQVANTDFKTQTLQVFQNLDKNRVPHGILLDFGMEFTNVQAFNGTLTDSTYTTSQTLSDVYKTLLMCRVRQVTTGFITPQEYATRWYSIRSNGVVTLSGQYFKYNRFADNAYPTNLNYINNQFSDKFVGTVWQNPYEEKQLFVMSPAVAKYKGLNFKVKLPSNLFFTNYPTTVQNIQVDFSDGLGFRIVGYDQLVNVNYTVANTYIWKYKITLTSGQILLSQSRIQVDGGINAVDINPTTCRCIATNVANLALYSKIPITASAPYLGYYGSATVYIKYANGGNTIRKPLIVAEGFDDGIILHPEQEAGSNNIEYFLYNINTSNSSLSLETNNYDIIYVDWNNGVDFIQRNAYVLEEVIKWVNTKKGQAGSIQQNVVLGQSMGGLIARYALRDMENKGLNHDTRLYVSHDAPHLGANTPLSIQYSARHLRNMYVSTPIPLLAGEVIMPLIQNFAEGFSQIINIFGGNTSVSPDLTGYITPLQAFSLADAPASRQMQYNWVNNNYQIINTIHDAWQQELSQMGYPAGYLNKPIKNVAIANGSECGITQVDNGNIMSYIKDAGRDTFLSNYIGIMDAVYGTLITNPAIIAASLFPGKSYWQIDFQSKYMTTLNENKNIYHGSITYKKKVFWFIPVSVSVTSKDVNQPSGVLPYDIYGGGVQKTDPNQLPISGIISNGFGFIPSASVLDIGKGATVINDLDYRKSYVGALPPLSPKNSPFQNFTTNFDQFNPNNNNSPHISFNTRNGNWLTNELKGKLNNTTNCSYMCSTNDIYISSDLCYSSGTLYAPSGASTYNWSITEGNSLVTLSSSFYLPSVSFSKVGTSSGYVTFTLTYGSADCGSRTVTKRIYVGSGGLIPITGYCINNYGQYANLINNYSGVNWAQPNTNFDAVVTNFQLATGTWSWVYGAYNSWSQVQLGGTNGNYLRLNLPQSNDVAVFRLTYTNACGVSEYQDFLFFAQAPTSYVMSPNPTSNTLTVSVVTKNGTNQKILGTDGSDIREINIVDKTGITRLKQSYNVATKQIDMDISTLNPDIYIVRISDGTNWITMKLIKQ